MPSQNGITDITLFTFYFYNYRANWNPASILIFFYLGCIASSKDEFWEAPYVHQCIWTQTESIFQIEHSRSLWKVVFYTIYQYSFLALKYFHYNAKELWLIEICSVAKYLRSAEIECWLPVITKSWRLGNLSIGMKVKIPKNSSKTSFIILSVLFGFFWTTNLFVSHVSRFEISSAVIKYEKSQSVCLLVVFKQYYHWILAKLFGDMCFEFIHLGFFRASCSS